jgi:GntR family transcriptional regulator
MSPEQLQRKPVYRQIADHYAEGIRCGAIKPGEKLPSETELMRRWQIASRTVRRAIKVLKDEGLVQTSRKGTYVIKAQ